MIKASSAEGLIVLVNPVYFLYRKHIIDRAADNRLPAIYEWKAFAAKRRPDFLRRCRR
jgi:hypothetical protein